MVPRGAALVMLAVAGAVGLAGCVDASEPEPPSYGMIEQGGQSGFKDNETRLRVVTDNTSWQEFWREHTRISSEPPEPPAVNFTDRFVAAVFLGMRPSGGYGVNVTRVVVEDDRFRIHYEEIAPGRGCAAAAVVTHPHAILELVRRPDVGTDVELAFEGERTFECQG